MGTRVGHAKAADDLAASIEKRIAAVRTRVAGRPRPRTLVVFDRESGTLRGIYASGGFGFIHDMVTAAGADNVFADVKQQAVQATTELVLARRPDVILELRGDPISRGHADSVRLLSGRVLPRCPRSAPAGSTCSLTRAPSSPVPWSRRRSSSLLARCIQRHGSNSTHIHI